MPPVDDNALLLQQATAPILLSVPGTSKSYDGLPLHPPGKLLNLPEEKPHLLSDGFNAIAAGIVKASVSLVFVPALFACPLSLLTFSIHYHYPNLTWLLVASCSIPVVVAFRYASKKQYPSRMKSPAEIKWGWTSFILFAVGWVAGTFAGDINYLLFMEKFYFTNALKAYTDISPNAVDGQQFMDAGRITFAEGTHVAKEMGMSYTSWDIYCVAPIVSKGSSLGEDQGTYDMWAVGKNCCKSDEPTFWCGDVKNPAARSGLRQVSEQERQYFGLAVQQAQAAYNINIEHPLFFHWVADPDTKLAMFFAAGFKTWVLAIFMCISVNIVLHLVLQWFLRPPPRAMLPKWQGED